MTDPINVAIVGIGNNASALLQGWSQYRERGATSSGVRLHTIAGYSISDIRFVCGIDVSSVKIGQDLSTAIFVSPNNFPLLHSVPTLGAPVLAGPRLDSIHESLTDIIPTNTFSSELEDSASLASKLRNHQTHVLLNFLPAGSPKAARFYALAAMHAGCAYINATPDPIVNDPYIVSEFEEKRLPLLGDDLESQMGATVIHRALLQTLAAKGVRVTGSYQINLGGNMDFQNLMVRGQSKERSKRRGLMLREPAENINVVPAAAYFPFLGDRKVAHITIETEGWLGCKNSIDVRLEIQDSSSAASVVADLIRIAKYALDSCKCGVVDEAGFYFKSPRMKLDIHDASVALTEYLPQ
jgi:myo-inositol-1-phosphate synthase